MIASTDIVQHRLHTGLGISGGGRGSLSRCASILSNYVVSKSTKDEQELQLVTTKEYLSREIKLQELELIKLSCIVSRQHKEINDLNNSSTLPGVSDGDHLISADSSSSSLQATATTTSSEIQDLRNELSLCQQIKVCFQEYEALAKVITKRHPVSRRLLQNQIDALDREIESNQSQLETSTVLEHLRESQFHLLQQCISDLKQSLNEPIVLTEREKLIFGSGNNDIEVGPDCKKLKTTSDAIGTTSTDNTCTNKSKEDDDVLYGDL